MRCQSCDTVLSFEDIIDENREGIFSQWKIVCMSCRTINIVPSSEKSQVNEKSYLDLNMSSVLGKYKLVSL